MQQIVRRLLEKQQFLIQNTGASVRDEGDVNRFAVSNTCHTERQLKSVSIGGVTVSVTNGNNCVAIGSDVCVVRNIVERQGEKYLIYQKFCKLVNFFTYPLPCSDLGIYLASELSMEMYFSHSSSCLKKYVLLPHKDMHVAIPLI